MTRREDHGSHTEHDAALFEAHRVQDTYDDDRPSLADCIPDEPVCTCYWTDPKDWFYYGSAVEPGSQMEPNPDCPVHFPRVTS
jgi:hypothetical protein